MYKKMKRGLCIIISFFLFSNMTIAQSKQDVMLDEAISLLGLGQKDNAYKILDDCLVKYPNFERGLFVRGNWSFDDKHFENALGYFEKLDALNPKFNPLQKKKLAECYFDQKNYEKAIDYISDFLKEPISPDNRKQANQLLKNIDFAISQPIDNFKIEYKNLGSEINTGFGEYFPSTNADESVIYFTRRNKSGEDIWLSQKRNNAWTPSTLIDEPEMQEDGRYLSINTYDNDGAHTISPNGKYLFFTSCQRPGGAGSCDLYFAALKGDEWGKPKLLPFNTKSWESQPCISADGRFLFFVSSRPGGLGGSDMYVSELSSTGDFSEPKNLGPNVNTSGAEDRPFIHPDGKSLYFSSDGHPGYGGRDLFMSRLENGEWQKPINLGNQINSSHDEISIFINALGNKAYIAKENVEGGRNDFDIYSFDLPERLKPQRVTYIKGIVTNAKTNQPLKASIKLTDNEKAETAIKLSSDEKKGDFMFTITADKEYGFNVSKEGFAIYSQNYTFKADENQTEPILVEIKLLPLETGTKFELRNVFFETAKYSLLSKSETELNSIVDILTTNPSLKILIAGHTDNVGNAASNQTLSENRAKSVLDYLVSKGISADRLSSKGYGASKPIAPNDTEQGRSKNRRTEIEVL